MAGVRRALGCGPMTSRAARLAAGGRSAPHGPPPGARPRTRRGQPAIEVVGAVAAVSAALRAGASSGTAWRRGLGVDADGGVPEWGALLGRCGGDGKAAGTLLAASRLAAQTGAPLADVLDRVGAAMAQDAEAAGQRRAALAGPRATARVLAWLPAAGVALGLSLGADPVSVLLDGGAGTGLLVVGGSLALGGHRWSRRCVRGAVSAAGES